MTPKQQVWWAFQPVKDAAPPVVKHGEWPRNEIDHFVLAELEARGMAPASPADRRAWLRRATFDLTGAALQMCTGEQAFSRPVTEAATTD